MNNALLHLTLSLSLASLPFRLVCKEESRSLLYECLQMLSFNN